MAVDYMIRWVEATSTSPIIDKKVGKFVFDYICSRFGTPLELLSDRGVGFSGELLNDLLARFKIKNIQSNPYYS